MCFNNKKCIINKENRNSCKACRYLKCEQVGMSIDSNKIKNQKFKIYFLIFFINNRYKNG
jgi:hypothetical protein